MDTQTVTRNVRSFAPQDGTVTLYSDRHGAYTYRLIGYSIVDRDGATNVEPTFLAGDAIRHAGDVTGRQYDGARIDWRVDVRHTPGRVSLAELDAVAAEDEEQAEKIGALSDALPADYTPTVDDDADSEGGQTPSLFAVWDAKQLAAAGARLAAAAA